MISVFDHGFLYGEGIYETLRTYDGRPFLYDRHLRRLNEALRQHRDAYADRIATHFPPGTRVTLPEGGMLLWLQLPDGASGDALFEINTTGQAQSLNTFDFKAGGGVELKTVKIDPGVLVYIKGKIVFVKVLTAQAEVKITYRSDLKTFRMDGSATIELVVFGKLDIKIGLEIAPDGIALGASLSVNVERIRLATRHSSASPMLRPSDSFSALKRPRSRASTVAPAPGRLIYSSHPCSIAIVVPPSEHSHRNAREAHCAPW